MEDQIPLNNMTSAPNHQNNAYQPSFGRTATAYREIGDELSNIEATNGLTTSFSCNPYNWSPIRKGLVLLVVLWCTSIGDFGSRISGAFKASVASYTPSSPSLKEAHQTDGISM